MVSRLTKTGQFSALLSKSDLSQFVVDEEILLAFLAASSKSTQFDWVLSTNKSNCSK